jgi:hypothetical protein
LDTPKTGERLATEPCLRKPKLHQTKLSENQASPRIPDETEAPPCTLEETRTLPDALVEAETPPGNIRQPT